jgi:vacuolar-type H+-ATPase subunit I/STV1
MIVNPQLFNYRLIIGTLVVVITAVTVYGFTSHKSIEKQYQFLEQEKKLVESELSQIIERYDDISTYNDLVSVQLEVTKKAYRLTSDSLNSMKSKLSIITKSKQQLVTLQDKNKILFIQKDSINQINDDLEKENHLINRQLQNKKLENSSLNNLNKNLNIRLEKGAILLGNSFKANSFERVLGKKKASSKAKRVKTIEVCFILAENTLAKSGKKDIYIQVVNPKNNVIADKGAVNFGASNLIYSAKKVVDYNIKGMEVCLDIEADVNDIPLQSGNYYISIFHENNKLGSTSIILE